MNMKVLHLSTFDLAGGAARAAYRIHQAMLGIDLDSQLLVQHKQSDDPTVIATESKLLAKLRSVGDASVLNFYQHRQQMFSPQWFPADLLKSVDRFAPDVIHLNWICNGFVPIELFAKFRQPLILTLHDMWSFTGGCHYTLGCNRYTKSCGDCPQLHSGHDADLSRFVWQRKATAWQQLKLTVVATSQWMAERAGESSLFRDRPIEVIPIGLDTDVFQPIDASIAREFCHLPSAKQLVLFGAIDGGDTRKGFHLLQQALDHLLEMGWGDQVELVVFGSDRPETPLELGFPVHYLGKLQDNLALKMAYAAADVTVVPSIEEAFGQIASESLACGTPVVAFTNTGVMDIVDCHHNGYVARYCDTADLAAGIAWVLADSIRHRRLRQAARAKAEREYGLQVQAHRYRAVFDKILVDAAAHSEHRVQPTLIH
jgi:glycosyltransferase involved in cell wall biosynthesis